MAVTRIQLEVEDWVRRRRVVRRTELRCESFWPATAKSRVRRDGPSLARPRSLPRLQIAASRNGRADRNALVSVAQYACLSVFLTPYLIDPILAI
jgi:hypothetical protein